MEAPSEQERHTVVTEVKETLQTFTVSDITTDLHTKNGK